MEKVILTAEAFEETRIDGMRLLAISNGSYYYWHKVLSDRGMPEDQSMDVLEAIPFPEPVQSRCVDEKTFIEYSVNAAERTALPPLSDATNVPYCHIHTENGEPIRENSQAGQMAIQIFGSNVELPAGNGSNYKRLGGDTANRHAEARGIQAFLRNSTSSDLTGVR